MTAGDNKQSFAVLFVDDEEKAQKYFRMAYANDFPVLTANGVPEALEVLARHGNEIGVLVTDQRMPGQKGVDLLKQARNGWPGIVRILTTAYSDLDDAIAAVNRGEISRYITKPWDIQALRVDLRHAMDFFLLRRERDLLMAEKLSVRQSMVHSDQLRSLLAIAGGLKRLRHAPQAVAAWLRDSLDSASASHPTDFELELWGLEIRETLGLMSVHRSLRRLDDSVESGYPDQVDLGELLSGEGLTVEGHANQVAAQRDLIERMIGILVQRPASATLEQGADHAENRALIISTARFGSATGPFTSDDSPDGTDVGLLRAYLIAWHHGGAIKATTTKEGSKFVLSLPEEPAAVVLPKPDEDWLAEQFSMLENWQ